MNEFSPFGIDLFGESIKEKPKGPVAEKFLFSPFSVLDARQGEWQKRKSAWIETGIQSEIGRDSDAFGSCSDWQNGGSDGQCRVSIFDPVLTECCYRWFCPSGGQIVDPFAGGSVRGIVASKLGFNYWGCDLRIEQIKANKIQAEKICENMLPVWVCGDSMETIKAAPDADFVFSCPPYGDLEKYSDDPKDLSSMEYHTFSAAYKRIIFKCSQRLKNNRFACFIVGDFRDKKGFYRDFVSLTIQAFKESGLNLYNEGILVTSVGSACMRVTKQFLSGRKFAKTHQNILVFCKGDWKQASEEIEKYNK